MRLNYRPLALALGIAAISLPSQSHSDPAFGPIQEFETSGRFALAEVGDFDAQRGPDVALVRTAPSNQISIFLNDGAARLSESSHIELMPLSSSDASLSITALLAGNVTDNSGLELIVAANNRRQPGGAIQLFLNRGNGTFEHSSTILTDGTPTGLALANLDQRSPNEILVTGSGDKLNVFRAGPANTFEGLLTRATGANPFQPLVADFNSDGADDILVANQSESNLSLFLGEPSKLLSPAHTIELPRSLRPKDLAVVNIDDTPGPDIVILPTDSPGIRLLANTGDGDFMDRGDRLRFITSHRAMLSTNGHSQNEADIALLSQGSVLAVTNAFSAAATDIVSARLPRNRVLSFHSGTFTQADFDENGTSDLLVTGWNPLDDTVPIESSIITIKNNSAPNLMPPQIGPYVSGSWFDPSRPGEGLSLQTTVVDGQPHLFAYWFTYQDGNQLWLTGAAPYRAGDTSVTVPLIATDGASFGAQFDPQDVVTREWGTITLQLSSCSSLMVSYDRNDGEPGELALQRIANGVSSIRCPR